MGQPRRLLTVKEFAAEYRVTERTVYQWMREGAVEVYRIAPRKGVRIVADDLVFFTASQGTSATN